MIKQNIARPRYDSHIVPFKGNRNAKVLVGIRRGGKSTLLEMIADKMDDDHNKIAFNMEEWANRPYRDPDKLYAKIMESLVENKHNCLFIDEVQDIREWESVVRSLIAEDRCDIYLTGSNSRLLSGEFATYLSGRLNTLNVFTLTLSECMDFEKTYRGEKNSAEVFSKFLRLGGFPNIWRNEYHESQAYSEISDITDAIIKKDIADRHSIRKTDVLDRILNFICDNIGNQTSINNIFTSLQSEDNTVKKDMVYDYIGYLEDSCLIIKVPTYDIKGKKHLTSKYKYYLSDIGIKNARLGFRADDISGYMENIIYLELRSRGYNVWIGDSDGKEVDIVGEMNGKMIYIQATAELTNEKVVKREFGNLESISDNHPKYVVTLEEGLLNTDLNGIKCCKLLDFLLSTDY
jgi:Predicted ATPase (AAA+ superfamily)